MSDRNEASQIIKDTWIEGFESGYKKALENGKILAQMIASEDDDQKLTMEAVVVHIEALEKCMENVVKGAKACLQDLDEPPAPLAG
jgi:hypothetical protein